MPPVAFTLVQLRYFVAAAEAGSMTGAAERLLIAQSAVSTAVSNLEHELGVQLFLRRRAKGLTPTPAGSRLLHEARKLLAHAREVADEAKGTGAELTGPVALGCFITLAPFFLPALLTEFADRCPGVEVTVLEAEATELGRALSEGRIDWALTYDLGFGPEVQRETVATVPAHALVAAGHRLAGRQSVDLAELAGEPLVLLDLPYSRDYFWSMVNATGTRPVVRHRTQSYETVRSLVARGHGFSVLNQLPATAQTYSGGEVVALPLASAHTPLDLVIAQLAGVRQTHRARALMDMVREVVAGAVPPGVPS
ncbi:LysR family transcriptional regulator [Streptomyces sp. NPDC090052]|uniref:LysR family transcriptional regulator n=1 Tax=unclassified Streptomyces TaxID=2593676 RepID=UPI0022531608|nr:MULTISPECIES: LysR family transcriptional regulator [unclassified Streptomyces]MCX4723143.1 LysR family transcriptional regulator [Streptomyces sp. NBC_01306]WSV07224.1 LysR family transcriptional regulator [Streptomyces sp. NBC_01020]WSX45341.1 LysR family transcriptional regulator [Streptomyces sp. NBC_00963]WSX66637.1 LysR family transcriptional regulator [Streptomyces sp. NBC_00932]